MTVTVSGHSKTTCCCKSYGSTQVKRFFRFSFFKTSIHSVKETLDQVVWIRYLNVRFESLIVFLYLYMCILDSKSTTIEGKSTEWLCLVCTIPNCCLWFFFYQKTSVTFWSVYFLAHIHNLKDQHLLKIRINFLSFVIDYCCDLKWQFTEQNRQMTHINVSKWASLLHGQENYPKLGKKFMQVAQSEAQFRAASRLRVKFNFLNRICLNEVSN